MQDTIWLITLWVYLPFFSSVRNTHLAGGYEEEEGGEEEEEEEDDDDEI